MTDGETDSHRVQGTQFNSAESRSWIYLGSHSTESLAYLGPCQEKESHACSSLCPVPFLMGSFSFLPVAAPPNPNREVAGDTIIFRDTQISSRAVYQCNTSNEHGYLLANAFVSVLGESQPTGSGAFLGSSDVVGYVFSAA